MKTFTFYVPKTTKFTTNNYDFYNYDTPAEIDLKNMLKNNAVNKYPWLSSVIDTPKKTKTTYNIKIKTKNLFSYEDLFNNYTFDTLINELLNYKTINSFNTDEYDFKINGVPVRIFDDRIQIGYNFISKNKFNANLDDNLKKTVYNMYITINNNL